MRSPKAPTSLRLAPLAHLARMPTASLKSPFTYGKGAKDAKRAM
jgi:hypothetical protein